MDDDLAGSRAPWADVRREPRKRRRHLIILGAMLLGGGLAPVIEFSYEPDEPPRVVFPNIQQLVRPEPSTITWVFFALPGVAGVVVIVLAAATKSRARGAKHTRSGRWPPLARLAKRPASQSG